MRLSAEESAVGAIGGSWLGHPVQRLEDPRFLNGAGNYVEDVAPRGCLRAVFVRSPAAHGRIRAIDVSDVPDVALVATAADLTLAPIPGAAAPGMPPLLPPYLSRPPLAVDTVRFVGEPLAIVVAGTLAEALDAAEAVVVDIEPYEAVIDVGKAKQSLAPLIHPEHGSNVVFGSAAFGLVADDSVLEGADEVVELRMVNQRLAAVPLETNAALAEVIDGRIRLTVPTQTPHGLIAALSSSIGCDPSELQICTVDIGGGFGSKAVPYPEFAVVAAVARRLGASVLWSEARSESMLGLYHGRGQTQRARLGLRRDGTFTGLAVEIDQDAGAWPAAATFLSMHTRMMAGGCYRIPRISFESRAVATNTVPVAGYRGAGRPEATTLLERLVDVAARRLDMDPVELRLRNLIDPLDFPFATPVGAVYDSGDYPAALRLACELADYPALRADQAERRRRNDALQLGIGVSCYVEVTAPAIFTEYGAVEVMGDGSVVMSVGTSAHGQGHETAFAMIVAEVLGIDPSLIRLQQGDTDRIPRGYGTGGSRSLQLVGNALLQASNEVLTRAKLVAADLLEAAVPDVTSRDGLLFVSGTPSKAVSWARVATEAGVGGDGSSALRAAVDFDQGNATFPNGAHLAVVEVDVETGRVALLRHVAVDDCGRVINPLIVEGQVHGGAAQGIAQALFEEMAYAPDGTPLTVNLMDYLVPSAADLPSFEATGMVTPSPRNPLGVKGIGESATIGSTPAVLNAVIDALGHLGVEHIDMPLGPERVWRAIRSHRKQHSSGV